MFGLLYLLPMLVAMDYCAERLALIVVDGSTVELSCECFISFY